MPQYIGWFRKETVSVIAINFIYSYIQGISLVDGFFELGLTERKHAINFNLKVDSDQGRLPIWYSTTKIQKNILQHPQNLCQSQIFYFEITIFFSFM